MTETLVIRLTDAADDPAEWVVVDATGIQLDALQRGALSAATALAGGRRVVALVAGADVLRRQVDLPVRGAAKVLQALPFALEDTLAEDVEHLHFAAAARLSGELVPVAVVRREFMDAWLARLAEAGITPDALFAEADGLPDIPGTLAVLTEAGRLLMRAPGGDPVAGDLESLPALLELALSQADQAEAGAGGLRHVLIYEAAPGAALVRETCEACRDRVESLEHRLLPEGGLPRLAAHVVNSPGVNLLQGPYGRRSGFAVHWPRWRLAASLAAGVLAAVLAANAAELYRLNRESASLDQAITQAFRYVFPDVRDLRDPRATLDSKLREMRQAGTSGGGTEFLAALGAVAAAMSQAGGPTRLETLNYRAGIMELKLIAPNVEAIDGIRKAVADDPRLDAEIQSANPEGEQVEGRIRVRLVGAS